MAKPANAFSVIFVLTACISVLKHVGAQDDTDLVARQTPNQHTAELDGKVIDDHVVDERNKPIAGALIIGDYNSPNSRPLILREKLTTSREGRFKLSRETLPLVLEAISPDGRQAGISRIGADQLEITILVGPLAQATGHL
jgi:hypothetical protein